MASAELQWVIRGLAHDPGVIELKEATVMSKQNDVPVAIVGAGPTGVLLAIELARRGVGVRVLDRQLARSPESRAIGIHARTLEIFHQLGILEEFLDLGHRVDGAMYHTRAGHSIRVRFGRIDSPYPFMLTLSQAETQRILDEELERLGVTIDRGVEVAGINGDASGVELVTVSADRLRGRTLHADWLIGCDGARSIVRRRLNVSFDGDDYGQDWLMAEVSIDWPLPHDHFHVFAYTPSVLPAFPLPSRRWRVFVPQVPDRAVAEREAPTMEEIEGLVAERGPDGIKIGDPTLLAAFRCYRRHTKIMRSGRVFLAGDAAHVHSPAGGQGMNTGLGDAFNLGWKLSLVVKGQATTDLLDTYQRERVPIAEGVLGLTHALVRTFTLPSCAERWLRDRLLPVASRMPVAERRFVNRMAQVSHNYRNGPLSTRNARPLSEPVVSGERLPDVGGLERGGRAVRTLDLLGSGAHTLLILSGNRNGLALADETAARFARRDGAIRTITVAPGADPHRPDVVADPRLHAHRRYRARRGRLVLVRPDGYVACSAPLTGAELVEKYLERLSSHPDNGRECRRATTSARRTRALAGATDSDVTADQALRALAPAVCVTRDARRHGPREPQQSSSTT
ncbi:MAG: FAD-dependent monooxygenase [Solirubrobacterales bacterium]|nr:FAD-dependent monooxygenase [Solirubrobacterales bacterium]